jgi:hypothetical protein
MSAALLLAAGLLLPAPSPAPVEAVVTVAVENMYAAPDESVDVVSQATLGQVVREDRLDDPHWSPIYQGARRPR